MNYATFWKRAAAYLLDSFICSAITYAIQFVVGLILVLVFVSSGDISSTKEMPMGMTIFTNVFSILLSLAAFLVYYAWPESSSWQATIGKRIFNLKVTDLNGQRITFLRSIGRNAGKILSGLILGIGFLMCLWTEKKQCLHDIMAGSLVIDPTPQEKTGCVIAVLIGSVVVTLLAVLFLFLFLAAIMPH